MLFFIVDTSSRAVVWRPFADYIDLGYIITRYIWWKIINLCRKHAWTCTWAVSCRGGRTWRRLLTSKARGQFGWHKTSNLYDIRRRKPSRRASNLKYPRTPEMKIRLCFTIFFKNKKNSTWNRIRCTHRMSLKYSKLPKAKVQPLLLSSFLSHYKSLSETS